MSKVLKKGTDFFNEVRQKIEELKAGIVPRFKLDANKRTTVRFLEEAEEFTSWYEHSLVNRNEKFYKHIPCISDEDICPLCTSIEKDMQKRRFKFATYIYNYETQKVELLNKGITVMEDIGIFYEKYGTLVDRDYEIIRKGSGLQTEYHILAESPSKFAIKTDMSEVPNILEVIRIYDKEEIGDFINLYEKLRNGKLGTQTGKVIEEDDAIPSF